MNKNNLRQAINVLAILVTLAVNIMANALPLNGRNTGEISDSFKVFFVPAGYVFSIWGLIYLGLIAFGIYQALPSQRDNPRLRSIDALFVFSCLGNSAWIFLWHYGYYPLTLAAMLTVLISLVGIYLRLDINRAHVSRLEKWMVDVPFSIYLGWITVATIANVTDLLYYLNWDGWGISPQAWAVIMLAVSLIVAAVVSFSRGDVAYLLVLVWAFVGIAVKQSSEPLVMVSALISAGLVILMILACIVRDRAQKRDLDYFSRSRQSSAV